MTKEKLTEEIKKLIIDSVDKDIELTNMDYDEPLFSEKYGLDSIDFLEITMNVSRKYDVEINDAETARNIFKSLNMLTNYLIENSPKFK